MSEADPLFGINLGFYFFRLPFVWFLYHFALVALILCLLSAIFVSGSWRRCGDATRPIVSPGPSSPVRSGALLFLVIAYASVWQCTACSIPRAGPFMVPAAVTCRLACRSSDSASAVRLQSALAWGRWQNTCSALGDWSAIAVGILGGSFYPKSQRLWWRPTNLHKEMPFIARTIEFTRSVCA
jgi:uncharacterized membrane protein (UPF0182 family)